MDFGTRLGSWLKAMGITQRELARRTKRSRAAISYYVNNEMCPSFKAQQEIVAALGVSMSSFFGPIPKGKKTRARA